MSVTLQFSPSLNKFRYLSYQIFVFEFIYSSFIDVIPVAGGYKELEGLVVLHRMRHVNNRKSFLRALG